MTWTCVRTWTNQNSRGNGGGTDTSVWVIKQNQIQTIFQGSVIQLLFVPSLLVFPLSRITLHAGSKSARETNSGGDPFVSVAFTAQGWAQSSSALRRCCSGVPKGNPTFYCFFSSDSRSRAEVTPVLLLCPWPGVGQQKVESRSQP